MKAASALKATLTLALLAAAATVQAAHAAGDPAMGEQVFKQCLPCHAIGPGATNKVGPELNGLDGRHSGSAPAYSYSAANKNSGITWDEASFKDYIKDPRAKIPGTKMIFPGVKDEKQADNLWAYLKQFGPDGNKK
jgi:cytochrome c